MKTQFFLCALMCLLWFSSCLTVKKIERNCDKFAKVCVTPVSTVTHYRDTTIYRTDTIYWQLPSDTVHIVEMVTVENGQATIKPVKKVNGLVWASAWINNNWLSVTAGLTDSTILIPRTDTIVINDAISTTTTTNTVTVVKKHIPVVYKITFWIVLLQVFACAVLLLSEFGVFGKLFNLFSKK